MIIAGLRATLATTSDAISRAVLGEAIDLLDAQSTAEASPAVRSYEIGPDGQIIRPDAGGGILVSPFDTPRPRVTAVHPDRWGLAGSPLFVEFVSSLTRKSSSGRGFRGV